MTIGAPKEKNSYVGPKKKGFEAQVRDIKNISTISKTCPVQIDKPHKANKI